MRKGIYYFPDIQDIGSTKEVRIFAIKEIQAVNESIQWDDINLPWDSLDVDWDSYGLENPIDDVFLTIQMRTSDDQITWSAWRTIFVESARARYFQFRAILTSDTVNHNIICPFLRIVIDMPDITIANDVLSGATAMRVFYTNRNSNIPFRFNSRPDVTASVNSPG